ncbi:MAG: HesA/MoeB/ThiF family protein [Deltaproteobacteria bacterium]|nr:HesA/MoeB/ThiF family protein [Deltaproteobacteria bacterium]
MTPSLSPEEALRYHRQMILPQIGDEGQKILQRSRVFLAGLGGLGSISAYYLAAAGIGQLRAVDRDRVDLGNLNRQLLHFTEDIGKEKTESAKTKLENLNPHCRVEAVCETIHGHNGDTLVGDAHLIVDGTDNLKTRKILNRVSIKKGIPFIFGGVDGLTGMTTTFIPGKTPCFECLFPEGTLDKGPPGVLGPLPGMIGALQALSAINFLLGIKSGLLAGRMLYIDGATMNFRTIQMGKNDRCRVCGADY